MDISIDRLDPEQKQQLLQKLLADRDEPTRERPLSFAQERLWFLDRFQPGLSVYNLPLTLVFPGPLDAEALRRALGEIVRRHAVLRTVFCTVGGEPRQIVRPPTSFELPLVDLSGLDPAQCEAETQKQIAAEMLHVFDLSEGPLFGARLVRTHAERHLLLLNMHHIVSDGWSTEILMREISALYQAFAAGRPSPLPELRMQYADFAEEQRARLSGPVLERHLAYWRKQLAGAPPVLDLPADRPRPTAPSFAGAWQSFAVDGETAAALRRIANRAGATLFMVLLAAFNALLFRYTGQSDLVVGTPIANRNRSEIEGLIGFFVNTLVLRSRLSGDLGFETLLADIRDTTLDAFAHQDLPFEKLVEELQPDRNLARNPLFQVTFTLQNMPGAPGTSEPAAEAAPADPPQVYLGTSKFDLTLAMAESGGRLTGTCEYSTDLFDHDRIARLIGHFRMLLSAVTQDPAVRISAIPLLTEAERKQQLVDWNDTDKKYDRPDRILAPFEARAAEAPDAEALSFEGESLAYAELNARANRLARHLLGRGVGRGVRVALCMDRSIEMIVSILAILKAGGTYVPLDPSHPRNHLAQMLADARVRILLTQEHVRARLPGGDFEVAVLDAGLAGIDEAPAGNPPSQSSLDDDLAIFFSSGSTGRPKGSLLGGAGFWNAFQWFGEICNAGQDTRILLMTPYSFDVSFKSIMMPLLFGGVLVLAGPESFDPQAILKTIERERVTTTFATPTLLYALLDGAAAEGYRPLASLRQLFFGAEPTDLSRLRPWLASPACRCAFVHNYGPSECSDVTTFHCPGTEEMASAEALPIGRPIANVRLYVVDPFLNLQPVGIPGELCIAGFMLARGYVGNPALTAGSFVPNPFSRGERMYRTGDLVRQDRDGVLTFLGRLDHQVKIRGIRVEPDGLARTLERHPGVREAVAVARVFDNGTTRLDAYYVAHAGAAADPAEIRDFLKRQLPSHMLPTFVLELVEFPLSANGKIDRSALPRPEGERMALATPPVAPRTPVEQVIAAIWCEVLDLREVGVHDDLFELGGHSLLATQIMSRVNNAFSVDLPIRRLFEAPTVAAFAASIQDFVPDKRLDEYARLLLHVASLSDQDVESELRRRDPAAEHAL